MIDTDKYEGHTPAPWIISEFKGRPAIHGGDETVVRSIARRLSPSHPADYKLIAAAPDLLAFYLRVKEIMDMEEIEEIVRVELIIQEMKE